MPRILFATNKLPIPPTTGATQRTNLLLRAMRMVAEVDVIAFSRKKPDRDELNELREDWGVLDVVDTPLHSDLPPWKNMKPIAPKVIQRLAHNFGNKVLDYQLSARVRKDIQQLTNGRTYDLAVGRYLLPTMYSGVTNWLPTILDVDDLDTQVYATRLSAPGQSFLSKWVVRRHLRQLQSIMPSCLAKMDHLWMASENDLSLVTGHPRVSVLPNIPFSFAEGIPEAQPENHANPIAIVVGSMNHQPNYRGVDRLISKVWPKVLESCPQATLRIIGSRTSDGQTKRWSAAPNVEVVGFVEKLADAYREANFAISPIYEGGGTKIKVLESLSYNRTCVCTKHSVHGYEHVLKDTDSLRITETDEHMAKAIIHLFQKPLLATNMAANGRKLVIEHFSFDRFKREVQTTIENVFNISRLNATD